MNCFKLILFKDKRNNFIIKQITVKYNSNKNKINVTETTKDTRLIQTHVRKTLYQSTKKNNQGNSSSIYLQVASVGILFGSHCTKRFRISIRAAPQFIQDIIYRFPKEQKLELLFVMWIVACGTSIAKHNLWDFSITVRYLHQCNIKHMPCAFLLCILYLVCAIM